METHGDCTAVVQQAHTFSELYVCQACAGSQARSSSGASAVFWRRAGVQAFTTHVRPKFGVCIPKAFLKHMLCSIL